MTVVLWALAVWFVGGSALAYVWLTWRLRAYDRETAAALDVELRELIDQAT